MKSRFIAEIRGNEMLFKTVLPIFVVTLLLSTSCLYGAEGDAIVGVWTTQEKEAKIEIYTCGVRYCGRISWLKEPAYSPDDEGGMAGKPKVDRNNPNPNLRARPLLGLTILIGFSYVGGNRWEDGRIYNPENGKIYRAKIKLAANNRLKLRGFVGISIFGETETWTR